jgi:predicted alpha/beta superfamily hydrolase
VSGPNLVKHEQFPSRFLRNQRDLIVYLPPGYDEQPQRHYPVLYLHDGQNLFDGATSFIPGMDWHVGQTADQFIYEGRVEPLIIVGIYNAGKQRLREYTPTRMPKLGGGSANRYAKFLTEEVGPFVRHQYRIMEPRLVGWSLYSWGCGCRRSLEELPRSPPQCGGINASF